MDMAAFASYMFLTAFTPGPNNIMAMTNAGRLGFRKGMRFCFGVLTGFFIDMILCATFTAMLFRYIPTLESMMKWVGASYILFLAWSIWRDKPYDEKKTRLRPDSFATGMVMQFINVKALLYGITALSSFILPHYTSFSAIALSVLVLSFTGFAGTCCWALFGSAFQRVFTQHSRLLGAVMALLLVYCAASLVFSH